MNNNINNSPSNPVPVHDSLSISYPVSLLLRSTRRYIRNLQKGHTKSHMVRITHYYYKQNNGDGHGGWDTRKLDELSTSEIKITELPSHLGDYHFDTFGSPSNVFLLLQVIILTMLLFVNLRFSLRMVN